MDESKPPDKKLPIGQEEKGKGESVFVFVIEKYIQT